VHLLHSTERLPSFYIVPFLDAAPTARRSRMLRDEHGMSAPWRLLAVFSRMGGPEALRDEITGMLENCRQSFLAQVFALS
jgi:hypothetical protein